MIASACVASVFVFGEVTHWSASRRDLGYGRSRGRDEAVVVLGYRNHGNRANFMNRFRVRAGIRSIDPLARSSVLVLCGGNVAGDRSEAELMDQYAREELGYAGDVRLECASLSTFENVQNAIALVEDADAIKIVSNSHHAQKARIHLWGLRPDLGVRLCWGADYRFGELEFVKPIAALLGLIALRRLKAQGDVA